MSRIGKAIIEIPEGVEINIAEDNVISVKGKLGELSERINPDLGVTITDGVLEVTRPSESKEHKAHHGLSRALIANMVEGVSNGYSIEQELVGVGYRAKDTGQILELALGYSHPIIFQIPTEVKVTNIPNDKPNKTVRIVVLIAALVCRTFDFFDISGCNITAKDVNTNAIPNEKLIILTFSYAYKSIPFK